MPQALCYPQIPWLVLTIIITTAIIILSHNLYFIKNFSLQISLMLAGRPRGVPRVLQQHINTILH